MSPDEVRYRRTLRQLLTESCQQLFADYRVPLQPLAADADRGSAPPAMCTVSTYSGKGLRGRLVLGSTNEPLVRSVPVPDVPLRDWMSELGNQLGGRWKNRLLPYDVTVQFTTPVTVRYEYFQAPQGPAVEALSFGAADGRIRVWLEAALTAGFKMLAQPDPSKAGLREGETLIL